MATIQPLVCAWAAKSATSILEGDVSIQIARLNKVMSVFYAKLISWGKLMEYATSSTPIASSQLPEPVSYANKGIFWKTEYVNLCPSTASELNHQELAPSAIILTKFLKENVCYLS